MNITLRYAARSDRGLVRDGNQDSVYAGPRLLAVADGMGGMAAGDVASNIVIAAIASLDEDVPGDALVDTFRAAVGAANEQLRRTVEAHPQMEGMGTTLTALLFSGTRAAQVHIGDSRAYLLRDGEFAQITKDDTYVQMLVDEGRITPEEAHSHPQRSLITRAMDGRDTDPDYSVRTVHPGDRYLLCSDGLSGVVSEETIAETLREYADPQECVDRLLSLALRGGGPDNVTVIVADATDEDIVESSPVVGGAAAPPTTGDDPTSDDSTPAARASALSTRPAAPGEEPAAVEAAVDDEAPSRRPRRLLRTFLLLTVLLALLAGGAWYGWSVTQSTYYVGVTEEGEVAVFRGLPARLAGVELSDVLTVSDYRVDDLRPHAQDRVEEGSIRADSAAAAEERMAALLADELKPLCPTPTPSPSPSPSQSPTPTATDDESADDEGAEEAGDEASPTAAGDDADATRSPSPTVIPPPVAHTPPETDPIDCRPA